jgi:hypothetical protein
VPTLIYINYQALFGNIMLKQGNRCEVTRNMETKADFWSGFGIRIRGD